LLVTPPRPSSDINRCSPPLVIRPRLIWSNHTNWPRWFNARSGFTRSSKCTPRARHLPQESAANTACASRDLRREIQN